MFLNIYKAIKQQEKQECESTSRSPLSATTIYDFTVKDTFDNDICLEKYRGYVVLIVNIGSRCQLASINYPKLMELKHKYYDAGLRIVCFPCNQFEGCMPEDGDPMINHINSIQANFGDVMKKIHVNGDYADPLFKYLKSRHGGFFGSGIKWNFTKFLINRNGIPVARFSPHTVPTAIGVQIEKLLN